MPLKLLHSAARLLGGLLLATQAAAQVVHAPIPVGDDPRAVAVNPATGKAYVANYNTSTVTMVDGKLAVKTIAVGSRPEYVAINPETGAVFTANQGDGSMTVIDADTDAVRSSSTIQVGGQIAINPYTDHAFILRDSSGDEVNIISGDTFQYAIATRAHIPLSLALNVANNRLYVAHNSDGAVTAYDMNSTSDYPTRECPDGNGGLTYDSSTNPTPPPCIVVPNQSIALAAMPTTQRIYSLSERSEIAEIQAPNNTIRSFMPPGAPATPVWIAANVVTNKVYAVYGSLVVVVDGATFTPTVVPTLGSGTNVGLAIDVVANRIYVPDNAGTLTVIDGDTLGTTAIAIPSGARRITVNPVTHRVYVLDGLALTVIDDTPASKASPLRATITPLANNESPSSGSISVSASDSMTPAPIASVRFAYYLVDGDVNGAWKVLAGSGPYSIPLAGLAPGSHTLRVFVTNGLDAPSGNTHKASAIVTSPIASYPFTIKELPPPPPPPPPGPLKKAYHVDFDGDGKGDLTWLHQPSNSVGAWLMAGNSARTAAILSPPVPGATVWLRGDFNGDGKTDLLWRAPDFSYYVTLMDGLNVIAAAKVLPGGTAWNALLTGDFNGDGKADILWQFGGNGDVGIWLMDGTAIARAGVIATQVQTTRGYIIQAGDFDGDGKADILWTSQQAGLYISLMDGLAVKSEGALPTWPSDWMNVGIGDFDGDGKSDLVLRDRTNAMNIWLMDGLAVRQAAGIGTYSGDGIWVRDLDGDNRSDLVLSNDSTSAWLMNGTTVTASATLLAPGSGWRVVGGDDYDGDGKDDLLLRDGSGRFGTWLMNGLSIKSPQLVLDSGTGWVATP